MIELVDDSRQLIGRFALDRNCRKIGTIGDVYLADVTGRPEWLAITIEAPDVTVRFVPLDGAARYGDDVVIAYDAATVNGIPHLDADGRLEPDGGFALFRHYGINTTQQHDRAWCCQPVSRFRRAAPGLR